MGAGELRVSSMSILNVNALGFPSARLSRSRFASDIGVAIEKQHSSAKRSPEFQLMLGE